MSELRLRFDFIASAALGLGLALACAGGGKAPKEPGMASDETAPEGFAKQASYETKAEWGRAWDPSGRGVRGAAARAVAETVDCSQITDEFEELYDFPRTSNPTVPAFDGELSETQYKDLQNANFRFNEGHRGGVIALLATSAGNRAKFIVHWNAAGLAMSDLVVYDPSGHSIHEVVGPMQLPLRFAADIDPIEPGSAGGETGGFDLLYGPDGSGALRFAAPKGAGISFPMNSLCAE